VPDIETAAKPKKQRLGATTLSEAALRRIIEQLVGTASTTTNASGGRFKALHERVRTREQHFYNLTEADPVLPAPHNDTAAKFQSDAPRRLWAQLKARLTENKPQPSAGSKTAKGKKQQAADKLERILELGFADLQRREGIDIVGELADGLIIQCYSLLHWEKAADVWPGMPDYEERDEIEDDERKRYGPEKVGGKYRETDASLQERDTRAKAQAGFPFYMEVYHPTQFAFIADRSMANGMGGVLTMRRVPMLQYVEELEKDGHYPRLSMDANAATAKRLLIYDERPSPDPGSPSADPTAWGKEVLVYQWWTRNEWYELVNDESQPTTGGWRLAKSGTHSYGMPPFALCKANETNSTDPALRYTPALDGVYRIKPYVDYYRTLLFAIAQQIALPLYYLVDDTGKMGLGDDGKPLILTRDALAAQQLPPGHKLEKVQFELNPAFVSAMDSLQEEFRESFPQTGQTELSATTQPWTARIGMTLANVEPARYVGNIAECLSVAFENIALQMSLPAEQGGFGRSVPMLDGEEVITIDPEDIRGLKVDVSIGKVGAAEQITVEEHGRVLLNDPLVPMTREMYVEEYMGRANASELIAAWDAQRTYDEYLRPGVVKQELARLFSEFLVMGANGDVVGLDGQVVDPSAELRERGWQVDAPPPPPGPSSVPAGAEPTMPTMPSMEAPGTPVLAGPVM